MPIKNNLPIYSSPEEKLNVFQQNYRPINIEQRKTSIPNSFFESKETIPSSTVDIQPMEVEEIVETEAPQTDYAQLMTNTYNFKNKNYINQNKEKPDPSTMAQKMLRRSQISENSITQDIDNMDISSANKHYLKLLQQVESNSNPQAENSGGYIGLYQFGNPALKTVGMKREDYMQNITNQHIAALRLKEHNLKQQGLAKYVGKTVDGITLNHNNLQAAQHLVGAQRVLEYLSSNGENVTVDGNNVPLTVYLVLFQ